jgi:hypothetical protein
MELAYLSEAEYVDGETVGIVRNWWFPDTNINESYGVDNGCGRGVGDFAGGVRNGYNTVECYIGYKIPDVPDSGIIRWDDCIGEELVHIYRGNMINDNKEDDSGTAYMMNVSPEERDVSYEIYGQFSNDKLNGYGRRLRNGVLMQEGNFIDYEFAAPDTTAQLGG